MDSIFAHSSLNSVQKQCSYLYSCFPVLVIKFMLPPLEYKQFQYVLTVVEFQYSNALVGVIR